MLAHLSFGVSDLERANAFYEQALAPLGYVRVWRSETAAGFGAPGGVDKLALFERSGERLSAGPGFHLALRAPSRAAVDAFHAAALAAGGRDTGAPGLRPNYGEDYYAAFVTDPDGWKLEAVHKTWKD